jgi:cytochrome b involved in lipid metabolism
MKKSLLAVSMALVLSIVAAPGSSASVKAGAACKKAGQISNVSGKKFTCVKKGSKLVWNKGVAVKRAPSVKATPAASAAPATPAMSATPAPSKSAEEGKSDAPAPVVYTMERVRANDSADYCFTVISGKVYDLTKWIKSHPGGSGAILSLCGTDGTAAFNSQHRGEGTPTARLAGYLLGPLAK